MRVKCDFKEINFCDTCNSLIVSYPDLAKD